MKAIDFILSKWLYDEFIAFKKQKDSDRHREYYKKRILLLKEEVYRWNKDHPDRHREIALKSYHKRKQLKNGQTLQNLLT